MMSMEVRWPTHLSMLMIQIKLKNVYRNQRKVTQREKSSKKKSKDRISQFNMISSLKTQTLNTLVLTKGKVSTTSLILMTSKHHMFQSQIIRKIR